MNTFFLYPGKENKLNRIDPFSFIAGSFKLRVSVVQQYRAIHKFSCHMGTAMNTQSPLNYSSSNMFYNYLETVLTHGYTQVIIRVTFDITSSQQLYVTAHLIHYS